MISAGIDAGSRAIKVVLFDTSQGQVLASDVADQGLRQNDVANDLFARLIEKAGLERSQIASVVATGYGRNAIALAQTALTEITCHARGVHFLAPDIRTIIEIGGQDSKVISLEADGRVRDFSMNDRCAAGTGRFLEMLINRFGFGWAEMAQLRQQSKSPALINNTCVVFAESEIIGLLAEGKPLPDIVAGVQNSIATRVAALAGRFVAPPVCFTGGVALQAGMAHALSQALSCAVSVSPHPQFTGALGAALLAAERQPERKLSQA